MQETAEFRFLEEPHEYWLGDRKLPSQSEILRSGGLIDDRFYTVSGRERGKAVHAACQYYAEGDLDMDLLDPALRGYVVGYQKFLGDTGFIPQICEKPIFHPTLEYGTTPDQVGILKKLDTVVELKSGVMMPWTAIQTAFQTMAIWPNDFYNKQRIGVELHPNGTYRAKWFNEPEDFDVAQALISVFNWKINNGGKPQ